MPQLSNSINEKLLLISVEAMDHSLVKKWVDSGDLKFFKKWINAGKFSIFKVPEEISSGAIWPTINTGVNPGKHGITFNHRQLINGTYNIGKKYAETLPVKNCWEILNENGIKSFLFDIPMSRKISSMNGIQIIGWGDEHLSHESCSVPESVLEEILEKYGPHPLVDWYQSHVSSVDSAREFYEKCVKGLEYKMDIIRDYAHSDSFHMFLFVFAEVHWCSHILWHFSDESHPEFNPVYREKYGDPILNIYKEMEAAIEKILREISHSNYLIFSHSGMGPAYHAIPFVPVILERLGLSGSTPKKSFSPAVTYEPPVNRTDPVRMVEDLIPASFIMKVKKLIPTKFWDRMSRRILDLGNKRKHSKAFALPNDNYGSIRINLKGREPQGTVLPGKEYNELLQFINNEFERITNVETGEKLVDSVIIVRNKYNGGYIDHLGDIQIKWNTKSPNRHIYSPAIGHIKIDYLDKRSGAHQTDGFILPDGSFHSMREEYHAADLMPSILQYFGIEIPGYLDGAAMQQETAAI